MQPSRCIEEKSPFPERIHDMIVTLPNYAIWRCRQYFETVCVLHGLNVMLKSYFDSWIRLCSGTDRPRQRNGVNGHLGCIKSRDRDSRIEMFFALCGGPLTQLA